MDLVNYSLKVKNRILLQNVNIKFEKGIINHLLGKNGIGKSCFAKSIINAFPYTGKINTDTEKITLIGSYTNIPLDLNGNDIIALLKKICKIDVIQSLIEHLNIKEMPLKNKIKNLSDGQKQKLKLLFFLAQEPELIILDEFTNGLDKKTSIEIYKFLNNYTNKGHVTLINITHNLADLEYMEGNYYLLQNEDINQVNSKEMAIDSYIKG